MEHARQSLLARYAAAALGVAAATLVTHAVPPLREQSATILFVGAVIVATWWAGPWPGVVAAVLSALSIDFFFLAPRYEALSTWDDLVRMSAFGVVCALVTILDASRRAAEAGLRRSEARFRRLSESRLLGIHVATRSGALVDANDAFLEMIGYSREELRAGGIDLEAITPEASLDDEARAFLETEARGVCTPFEKEYVRRDGSRVPVLTGSARLDDDSGERIWLTIDVTARKRAELARRLREVLDA